LLSKAEAQIKEAAELSLLSFIRLVAPKRMLGAIHEDVVYWWSRENAKDHQLLLLPRGHQKSNMIAYRAAWRITKNPEITILYQSATSGLAELQLRVIQDILTSKIYKRYWPDMVHSKEGKREKWNTTEICVDHPKRKEEGIRDSTVLAVGLTSNTVGFHCDISILDDIVTDKNAYTEEGRRTVKRAYSLLSSIENPDSEEWVVGTRYHPKDLYQDLIEMEAEVISEDGTITGSDPVYEVFSAEVEDKGDGTGEFLWPRQRRTDGKWFGFNASVLAIKRAKYKNTMEQYYAQYYNNPNDPDESPIDTSRFQYYDKSYLKFDGNHWTIDGERLNIFAAVDFAYSIRKRADYTAIVVIGITSNNDIYVLDIDRFKTKKIRTYYEHLIVLHNKWGFRKLRAEVNVAQASIVEELKTEYFKPNGINIKIDEFRPQKEGSKEERIRATLEPKYDNLAMWHYRGGNCQLLEEELTLNNPPHDDIKDALSAVVGIASAPTVSHASSYDLTNILTHSRFGGVAF